MADYDALRNYLHCIAMGSGNSIGIPDGNSRPAFVRDYRVTYTLKPDANGRIAGALFLGFNACLTQFIGDPQSFPVVTGSAASPTGFNAATTASSGYGTHLLAPVVETAHAPFSHWRPVNLQARFEFSGSSMYNAGTFLGFRAEANTQLVTLATSGGAKTVPKVDGSGVLSSNAPLPATAISGLAKDRYVVSLTPNDIEYDPTPSTYNPAMSGAWTPGYMDHYCVPMYSRSNYVNFNYAGLHPDASIKIDISYCVQTAVSTNSLGREFLPLAAPSPLADRSLLNKTVGWLANQPIVHRAAEYSGKMLLNHAARYIGIPLSALQDH